MALRDACIRAITDENRHADLMQQLAHTCDGEPVPVIVKPGPPRSLFALACDNAVEGCVREAFGALEALWQSHTARDPALRRAMAEIAEDEARHAELAWDIVGWVASRDQEARATNDREISLHAEARHRLAGLASA